MLKKILILFFIIMQTFIPSVSQKVPTVRTYFSLKNSGKLKILSWNIYMLPYLSLFNGNSKRAKIIAEKLSESDYNVIVFQEAFSSVCRGILSKRLKDAYPFQYGPINRKHSPLKTSSGLWVVSKFPLKELDEIKFAESKGYDAVAYKGAVIFQGNYNGTEFQLVTTHLQAEDLPEIRKRQCNEIKEKLLNKYEVDSIPQIICGDFNIDMDDEKNYPYMLKTLDAKNGDVIGDSTTYDQINNTLSNERNGRKRVIDYVLIRNAKKISKIERTVKTFYENRKDYIGNLSDHYAMEANVFLENDIYKDILAAN